LFCIEDSAHAHGAESNGQKAGSLCDAAAFSFFPTKPMTTAEGGMITTDNADLAAFARTFRNHGVPEGSSVHEQLGHNYRMDELSAILGLSQIRMLDDFIAVRNKIARMYHEGLADLRDQGVFIVSPPSNTRHSYYKFPLLLPTVEQRNAVSKALKEKHGIDTGTVYWPPCHLQPIVKSRPDLYGVRGEFPASEDILPRILCLPIHARLSTEEVARVIDAVHVEVARPAE
jgi:dTDP-4-amino-4,6-dideoxygalactose transaminase